MIFNLINCSCDNTSYTYGFGYYSTNSSGIGMNTFFAVQNAFRIEVLFKIRKTIKNGI